MRIAIGSDHRGVAARKRLIGLLQRLGNEVIDCGSDGDLAVDYPDIAADVARRVSDASVERGILLCCTGVGMAIAANKHKLIAARAKIAALEAARKSAPVATRPAARPAKPTIREQYNAIATPEGREKFRAANWDALLSSPK